MSFTIIEHPAQQIDIRITETFNEFSNRIETGTQRPICYKNGEPIELDAGGAYSFIRLKLPRLLTPQEFGGLLPYLMGGVQQAEQAGIIPSDLVQEIATTFDVPTVPAIPDEWLDDVDSKNVKFELAGVIGVKAVLVTPEPEPTPEEPIL